ncbi:MAG: DNA-binding response regulator [Nevskiales bacterium]
MKVLLVDDDPDLLVVIRLMLEQEGFEVVQATGVAAAITAFRRERLGLVLLDVNLPDGLGFDVCLRIRAESQVPILMLSVRDEEADIVRALELGADDYLTKPFSPKILVTRIKALLRRTRLETAEPLRVNGLRLDPGTLTLHADGSGEVRLTRLEFSLLQLLFAHVGETVHADRLMAHVWGRRSGGDRHVLSQLVHRLRGKLEGEAGLGAVIESVPGLGYQLRPQSPPTAG